MKLTRREMIKTATGAAIAIPLKDFGSVSEEEFVDENAFLEQMQIEVFSTEYYLIDCICRKSKYHTHSTCKVCT